MQDSRDTSLPKPDASDMQCDSAGKAPSESRNSAQQSIVPANSAESLQNTEPGSPDKENGREKETEHGANQNASALGEEHTTGESTHHEEEQKTAKKEPLPGEIPLEPERKAPAPGAPVYGFKKVSLRVTTDGLPAKTAGLSDMVDLIGGKSSFARVRYISAEEDGIINCFVEPFQPWDRWSLYEFLTLPADVQDFGTTRELFDSISALLRQHVMLPSKDCSLLAYWAIATWFTDYLPFLPSVIISGPASTADLLLRTLAAVCRRPVLLGELSPAILRKLPINELTPTLLVREPQLSRHLSALLNASNQPGYLFLSGQAFQQLYCPKCIYVGECFKDSSATSNSLGINLAGIAPTPRHALPTKQGITSFQNRLLFYRLLNHDKVASANFPVAGFRPETSVMADVLAAAIVGDVELQRGVIEVLKERDEQSRADCATGVNGLVLRAVLCHCHQKDQQKFVREIADTAKRLYAKDGESLKLSNETVGHVLKNLGLYSRRLGNAGRGLIFDKATQSQAHRLSHAYDVLTSEPSCEYCHAFQQSQKEELT